MSGLPGGADLTPGRAIGGQAAERISGGLLGAFAALGIFWQRRRLARIAQILPLNGLIDFLPVNRNLGRCLDSETHFVTSNVDDRDLDVVTDNDALVALSRQYKHRMNSFSYGSMGGILVAMIRRNLAAMLGVIATSTSPFGRAESLLLKSIVAANRVGNSNGFSEVVDSQSCPYNRGFDDRCLPDGLCRESAHHH
jgi:hypothetical protein